MVKKKKRTITPEQQAKMQAGRKRKKTYEARVGQACEMERRVEQAGWDAQTKPTMKKKRKRRYL